MTIAFLPIFVANLIFAVRFKGVGNSTTAFGANLLGAMVGGALEYLALILGFNALLGIVAVCYTLACSPAAGTWCRPARSRQPAPGGPSSTVGRYSSSWSRPSKVRDSSSSRRTSG